MPFPPSAPPFPACSSPSATVPCTLVLSCAEVLLLLRLPCQCASRPPTQHAHPGSGGAARVLTASRSLCSSASDRVAASTWQAREGGGVDSATPKNTPPNKMIPRTYEVLYFLHVAGKGKGRRYWAGYTVYSVRMPGTYSNVPRETFMAQPSPPWILGYCHPPSLPTPLAPARPDKDGPRQSAFRRIPLPLVSAHHAYACQPTQQTPPLVSNHTPPLSPSGVPAPPGALSASFQLVLMPHANHIT
jgi:hypothetical protein